MAITNTHIRETVEDYIGAYPGDKVDLVPLLTLLEQDAALSSRKEFRGHATAGAVLADEQDRVLVIHHRALSLWLLPGGHLEPDDNTLLEAALRELTEETGILAEAVKETSARPLHIDTHPIPANATKQEPEHRHIDFRFLFRTSADIGELQAEEVNGAEWRDVAFISDPELRKRVASALR
ncbi:NUDIX hydrolase [Streptomyces iconiensis]|uniref:NUDIX domain-containing protein n=1 Tax=Streptomyces iconiensis TaxID=1384038 RepID=A0ABT6ZY01_9ACTN|nr:NUDIX domain-containing protein [Streptomyces iconiensis]MDJ1133940.1 NUDIX domain-containing protein [Streptomyces iconiensis]